MNVASVVISTYDNSRLPHLHDVIEAWLEQTNEVILCDCSDGKFHTTLPIIHVQFNKDLGNKTRHALSLLTSNDFVIKADDDVLPRPGLIQDLHEGWLEVGGGIVGLLGRTFEGVHYTGQTTSYRANFVVDPVRVDFVGITTFSPRNYLAFDLKGCLNPIEDLFWQMKHFPDVPKWVVPSVNFKLLPESENPGEALYLNTRAQKIRQNFYEEYYLKNYT